jgi:hypothetical protein
MRHEVVEKPAERQPTTPTSSGDAALAASLAKLWPHRWHESNWLKNLFCQCGLHNWKQLYLDELLPKREVRFCYWCTKVRLDGVIYDE